MRPLPDLGPRNMLWVKELILAFHVVCEKSKTSVNKSHHHIEKLVLGLLLPIMTL